MKILHHFDKYLISRLNYGLIMRTLRQWLIVSWLFLLPFIFGNCKKDGDTDKTFFKDSLGCFPNLPSPELIYIGKNVNVFKLSIKNCGSYPFEIFVSSPDLPPCGQNTNASRTWLNIYNSETDELLYGYCGINSPCEASDIQCPVPQDYTPPFGLYVKYIDRKCEREYVSNTILINEWQSCPVAAASDQPRFFLFPEI